jgi:hypothetical protein
LGECERSLQMGLRLHPGSQIRNVLEGSYLVESTKVTRQLVMLRDNQWSCAQGRLGWLSLRESRATKLPTFRTETRNMGHPAGNKKAAGIYPDRLLCRSLVVSYCTIRVRFMVWVGALLPVPVAVTVTA